MVDRWLRDDPAKYVRMVGERLDDNCRPRIVSIVSLTDIIRSVFQNGFIGWKTHPAALNRGYCTEAVRLALQFAFADDGLGLHRVQADILPDNAASCRGLKNAGFVWRASDGGICMSGNNGAII
jgi:RimJ/RimL family protein N-acetyltransferase